MARQPFVYTPIHKGIRNRLFRISAEAARLNFSDKDAVSKFQTEFISLVKNITYHHELEEKFLHPLLADRVPGGAEKLEEEHRVVLHLMANLVNYLNSLFSRPAGFESSQELGLEFYLAYNRFVLYFMEHLNEEEQHIQRSLWHLCTPGEVAAAIGKMLASQEPAMAAENLEMVISSVNLDELADILKAAKPNFPAPVFQGALSMVERIRGTQEFNELKARI